MWGARRAASTRLVCQWHLYLRARTSLKQSLIVLCRRASDVLVPYAREALVHRDIARVLLRCYSKPVKQQARHSKDSRLVVPVRATVQHVKWLWWPEEGIGGGGRAAGTQLPYRVAQAQPASSAPLTQLGVVQGHNGHVRAPRRTCWKFR